MKKLTIALILSIIIHILFLVNLKMPLQKESPKNENKENIKTSNVKLVQLKQPTKESITKPTPLKQEPQPVKKVEQPKPVKQELKKVQEVKPTPKRETVKEPQKTTTKPKTAQEVTPNFTKQTPKKEPKTPLQKEQEKLNKDNLSNFLQAPDFDSIELDRKLLDDLTNSYLDLYGEEYKNLSETQKIYLHKNLKDIGRITQRYLRYPELAARLRQDGTNVVEFMLHPNGDISDLKLITPSGSKSLDENSVDTIWIAYKDYPRPEQTTKIKIYINYYLY